MQVGSTEEVCLQVQGAASAGGHPEAKVGCGVLSQGQTGTMILKSTVQLMQGHKS